MNCIDIYLINNIIILFPLLINNYYFVNKRNYNNKNKHDNFISLNIIVSLIYLIRINKLFILNYYFIFLIYPLLISLLYRRNKTSFFICIIIIELFINIYKINSIIIILLFTCYYKLYNKYLIKDNSTYTFIKKFELITLVYLNIQLIIKYNINLNYETIIKLLEINIPYLLTGVILNLTFSKSSKVIDTYLTIKDFEREKRIKDSLFKLTHEIKNPLAVINGYLQMFDVNDKKKSKRYIAIMKNELTRTLNLLTDFMQYSKIKIDKNEFMIFDLFNDINSIVKPILIDHNIKYIYQVEENLIINADYERMKQVILNLIKNSIEACEGKYKPLIEIMAYKTNSKLLIIVKDNGTGMDKEILDKIKVPFYTTKANGTGLGVSLSKEIIEAHSGNLSYTSIKNEKTIAKIVLPI
jgi:two-component system, sporulation sensor kinase B